MKELQPSFVMGRCPSEQDRSTGGSQPGSRPQTPQVSWRLTAEQEVLNRQDLHAYTVEAKQEPASSSLIAKVEALQRELDEERKAREQLAAHIEALEPKMTAIDGLTEQLSLLEPKIQEVVAAPAETPAWETLQAEVRTACDRLGEVEASGKARDETTNELIARLERGEASRLQTTAEIIARMDQGETAAQELRQRAETMEEAVEKLRLATEATGPTTDALLARLDTDSAELRRTLAATTAEAARSVEQLRQEFRGDIDRLLREANTQQDAGREQIESVKSELESSYKALQDQASSAQRSLETARREIAATSDDGRRYQDQLAALAESFAQVKQGLAELDDKCSARLESFSATQSTLKTIIFRDVEEVKPWLPEVAELKRELQSQLQEFQSELSKGLTGCQNRLSTTRLDLQDKLQFVEDRAGQAEYKATEASETIARLEPSIKQLQEASKEVAQLRSFQMEQASKIQNATAGEMMNLETKVQREMASAREHCSRQVQQVELASLKLREQVADAVERVKVVADGIQEDFVQERQRRADEASSVANAAESFGRKQLEELREHFVKELVAVEGRMLNQESSVRQFATEQAGQLWVSVQDLQEATKKLEKRTAELADTSLASAGSSQPKVAGSELSVEEVQQFKTQRVSSKSSVGPFSATQSSEAADESGRKSQRLHREELLQRLSDAESRLQQQQTMVQRQKEDINQQVRKWSSQA